MLPTALLLLALVNYVTSIRLPFEVRVRSTPVEELRSRHLAGRADASVDTTNGSIPVANTLNSQYISNITLGGRTIPVLLDTGSSDLWVTGAVAQARDSGVSAKLDYAVGAAHGNIFFATLGIDNFTVPDQAFLDVVNTSTFSTNISAQGYNGLIGLGPNSGSIVRKELDEDEKGDAVMDRIFAQNPDKQSYITFLLDRKGDPTDPFRGQFTIQELVAGFESITEQPKLPVIKVHRLTDEDQHWQVYTDVDGLIGPDGQPIRHESIVPKAPDGQLVVVIDTGFTLPQVPRPVADAIYGRVQGANWDAKNQLWTIPCTQELNISFKFGGKTFPIHPLDVSSSDFNILDANGQRVCVGTFQPITSAFSLLGEYDMILGMAFLRNTYTLIDFGNFVEEAGDDRNDPFVQMLSVTDRNQAHDDFVKTRLNGVDTTGDASHALLPESEAQHSPISDEERRKLFEAMILSRWPYILLGSLAFIAICIGLCVWRCCRNRRLRKANAAAGISGSGGGKKGSKTHRGAGERQSVIQASLPLGTLKGSGGYRTLDDYDSPQMSGVPPPYPGYNHDPYRQ